MRRFLPVVVVLSLVTSSVRSGEEPPELKLGAWLLKFQALELNALTVERASGRGRLDRYMIYSVTNESEESRDFNVRITAEFLDTLDTKDRGAASGLLTDVNVRSKTANICYPQVEEAVERKLGENFFGPCDVAPVRRQLLEAEGAEKAAALQKFKELHTIKPKEVKRCVATFGPLDVAANAVKIYVRNLTKTIGVKIVDGKRVLEEYVLVLTYTIPGDEFGRSEDRFVYEGKKWIKVARELPADRGAAGSP